MKVTLWDLLSLISFATPVAAAVIEGQKARGIGILVGLVLGLCIGVAGFLGLRKGGGYVLKQLLRKEQTLATFFVVLTSAFLYLAAFIWSFVLGGLATYLTRSVIHYLIAA